MALLWAPERRTPTRRAMKRVPDPARYRRSSHWTVKGSPLGGPTPGLERDASIRLDDEQPVKDDRPADVPEFETFLWSQMTPTSSSSALPVDSPLPSGQ